MGAHFALVDPKERGDSKDSEADLAKSVMTPVAFQGDAFYTDTFQLRISHRNSDQGRTRGKADWWWSLRRSVPDTVWSNHKMGWSLTKTHLELSRRYWLQIRADEPEWSTSHNKTWRNGAK